MIKLPYRISKKAAIDLEEIWLYSFEKWSATQADRYYDLIIDEISQICSQTNSGKSLEHLRKGYRVTKVKSHPIFYKVENNVVEVIRVLHERMDIENRLNE